MHYTLLARTVFVLALLLASAAQVESASSSEITSRAEQEVRSVYVHVPWNPDALGYIEYGTTAARGATQVTQLSCYGVAHNKTLPLISNVVCSNGIHEPGNEASAQQATHLLL